MGVWKGCTGELCEIEREELRRLPATEAALLPVPSPHHAFRPRADDPRLMHVFNDAMCFCYREHRAILNWWRPERSSCQHRRPAPPPRHVPVHDVERPPNWCRPQCSSLRRRRPAPPPRQVPSFLDRPAARTESREARAMRASCPGLAEDPCLLMSVFNRGASSVWAVICSTRACKRSSWRHIHEKTEDMDGMLD